MTPTIELGLIAGIPVLGLMVLRANATLVFLSLGLGDLLVQVLGNDTQSFLNLAAKHGHSANHNMVELGLLLLPVVLTTIFMIKSVTGPKLLWNLLPAVGVGLVGALLVVPLLPGGVAHDITTSSVWHQLQKTEDLIVGVSTLICLLFLWMLRPPHEGGHGKGKHKK